MYYKKALIKNYRFWGIGIEKDYCIFVEQVERQLVIKYLTCKTKN